jgi:hypothetical protein
MADTPPPSTSRAGEADVASGTRSETAAASRRGEMSATIEQLEFERQRLLKSRRRHIVLLGLACSVIIHLTIMIVLNGLHRSSRAGDGGSEPIEFAIMDETDLLESEVARLDDIVAEELVPMEQTLAEESPDTLEAEAPTAEMAIDSDGAKLSLGGVGNGSMGDAGLQAGGAGTSFFGISSKGTRFAYIVDKSGSMSQERRMQTAMRELMRSIEVLPDFAKFHVVLFSSASITPPFQKGWSRARPSTVGRYRHWLEEMGPSGGTNPRDAFEQVFALDARPDVIFFMTDGQISSMGADYVASLNAQGKRVTINTVAFGHPSSQELLRQIARDAGGVYRFVPSN